MKQKDIVLIVAVVLFTGIVTYVIANMFISSPKNRTEQVEVVEPITTEFTKPSEKYFNSNSIDPTQPIQIGDNNNTKPFSNPNGQ